MLTPTIDERFVQIAGSAAIAEVPSVHVRDSDADIRDLAGQLVVPEWFKSCSVREIVVRYSDGGACAETLTNAKHLAYRARTSRH